ncbi:MAG: transposase, partial [Desulfobulbaceae bacterium]|nr:transposase [Desulfobulbaceae bacterium]
ITGSGARESWGISPLLAMKDDITKNIWRRKTFGLHYCRPTSLTPMKKVAKMLRTHQDYLLNWFRCRDRIALGAVEGFNNKVKVITRKAYGYKSFDVLKIALYHTLGNLPEPKSTHKFC